MTNDKEKKTIKTKVEPQNDEPNEETYAAMEAAEKGTDIYGPFDSIADLMAALNAYAGIYREIPERLQARAKTWLRSQKI